jgi:acyl carrier protein
VSERRERVELSRARVLELLTEGVRALLREHDVPVPDDLGESTRLIGEHLLNSLDLVSVIVGLEERIEDEYAVSVTIADERAMSQRHSPFRTVGTLADYVHQLIAEAGPG